MYLTTSHCAWKISSSPGSHFATRPTSNCSVAGLLAPLASGRQLVGLPELQKDLAHLTPVT